MTTLIVGCGYLGRRVGRLLSLRGERVLGTARSESRAGELPAWGVEPILADVLDPGSLDALPDADRALYCVGFDRKAGTPMREVYVEGLRNALERLSGRVGRVVYVGSTSVYGQSDGSWVDESSPAEPRTESGRIALEAETVLKLLASERGLHGVILRYVGLYGPGRILRREALLRGDPISGDPSKWLNLIHIDDAAAAAVAALDRAGPGSLYLVSDDRPVRRSEFYGLAARLIGAPEPRFEAPAAGSPEAGRDEVSRRVSNRRLRAELGFEPEYPDIAVGLPAAASARDAP